MVTYAPRYYYEAAVMVDLVRRIFNFMSSEPAEVAKNSPSSTSDASLTSDNYEESARTFYAYLPDEVRDIFVNDALYHKSRYLELLNRSYGARILELGSDKPFISHYLRTTHTHAAVETVSIDIPYSKYPITRVDIEGEQLPFEAGSFTDVIFTEVLEHLFRDPAWTIYQINAALAMGGTLFLTTPNACGYDSLINFVNQVNPNARSQFYAAIESGHPHLWTANECRDILVAHGFSVEAVDTVDYVPIPRPPELMAFLDAHSRDKGMNGQSLRIVAKKVQSVTGPTYPRGLFPEGMPVQMRGALREWAVKTLANERP
ncbi:class I SAM-dependent methyltransferase [Aquincola sp. S2]|uniref:Class I SAM-dependent methyltransferase n=1 Tax=Pseudaquabacterium terrae TaxID=2732868 RepID=A0ABX2EDZ1_9BURK|nr:class I SAM-dependent methyltransferase [Aquabacterium terrae]NRF66817.1 class I SAM-dependent methyltransferase [Aquabacterium terrae]